MDTTLNFEEVKYSDIKDFFPQSFYDQYDNIKKDSIEIKFGNVDELNPGRWVLWFKVFENGIDITKKIFNQEFCSPIRLNFIHKENNIIYFPFEGHFIFYNTLSKKVTKIEYDTTKSIYENNDRIIILKDNGYSKINLENLEFTEHHQENINFVYSTSHNDIIFFNDFLNYKTLNSTFSNSLQIEISNLYDTSFYKYLEKSHEESQKGYLWSNSIKVKNNEPFSLPNNKWRFIKLKNDNSIIIGTQLITSKGEFNEVERTMIFNVENKYLKINLNNKLCSTYKCNNSII